MKSVASFALRLTVFFGALAGGLTSATASAAHAWGPYHWAATSLPFSLSIGDSLTTANWKAHLATTIANWNSPAAFGASTTPIRSVIVVGQAGKRCSMVAGTTQVCNGGYGFNGWLGLATINIVNGQHITQGSAKLNDSYFDTTKYNNPNQRLHVMCQEVAHTFGLGHQSENGSSLNTCMDYFSNTGVNATSSLSTTPNKHDFDQLNLIYSHADSSTTVASTPKLASRGLDITDDPSSWGQLMSQSANGRSSVYERFNADGSKTVTHVYWTEEAAARCGGPGCDHRFGD